MAKFLLGRCVRFKVWSGMYICVLVCVCDACVCDVCVWVCLCLCDVCGCV